MKQHGLYKYVCDGEIIYIGKSDNSVYSRIKNHKNEKKFKPFLEKGCEIYTCSLPNATETEIVEKALINQYKPILNRSNNEKGFSSIIKIDEPKWILFEENKYLSNMRLIQEKNKKAKEKELKDFPSELLDIPYIAFEQEKRKKQLIDVLVLCPNGRTYIPGYKKPDLTLLGKSYIHYPKVKFEFYKQPIHKTGIDLVELEYRKINYDPQKIFKEIFQICEEILVHDNNFGNHFIYTTNENDDNLIKISILNSGFEIRFDYGWSKFNFCSWVHHINEMNSFHINKSVIFKLYIHLLYFYPEKIDYHKLLTLYFKISSKIYKDDIKRILEISGVSDKQAIQREISRIENIIGEYEEDKENRRKLEYIIKQENKYNTTLNQAKQMANKARFIILSGKYIYIINKKKKNIIEGLIINYGEGFSRNINKTEFDIPIMLDNNTARSKDYPCINMFDADYKEFKRECYHEGIPILNTVALKIFKKNELIWEIPNDYFSWNSPDDSWFKEAIMAMVQCGY